MRAQLLNDCERGIDTLRANVGAAQSARDAAQAAYEKAGQALERANTRLEVVLWLMANGRTEEQATQLQVHCEDTGGGGWDLRMAPGLGVDTDISLFEVCPGLTVTAP